VADRQDEVDARAIIRGVFEIFAVLTDIARDVAAIRSALEDDGEEEDHDG
jgi:hypothetical protein